MARRRSIALLSTVACLGLVLSACGDGGNNRSTPTSAPMPPKFTFTPIELPSSDSAPTGGSGVIPLPGASQQPGAPAPSAAPTGASTAPAPAKAPAGYQSVSAPMTGISFAIPQDWSTFTKFDDADHAKIAEIAGISTQEAKQSTTLLDMMGLANRRGSSGVLEQVMCVSLTLPLDEATVTQLISDSTQKRGETLEKTSSVDSANGKVQYGVTYNPKDGLYGGIAYLPNSKGSMVTTRVYAGTALRVEELLGVMASTLR